MNVFRQIWHGLQHFYAAVLFEMPAQWTGIDRLIKRLEKSGQTLEKRIRKFKGQPANQEVLAHMIGIERWGQRRLRVALGEPLIEEEYDAYCPHNQDWDHLLRTFVNVRQETISLCKSLRMAGIDLRIRILHNQFGEISLLGWLFYLTYHASIESIRIH